MISASRSSAAAAAAPGGTDASASGAVDDAALVEAARQRVRAGAPPADRRSALLTGGSFLLVMGAWLAVARPSLPWVAFAVCVVAHVVASSVEFEIGPGSALPTTPVLVVALYLLPPSLVPIVAFAGLTLAAAVARLRDADRHERLLVLAGSAWHAVGPAAVFAAFHVHHARAEEWPILGLAVISQVAFDALASWVRNCRGLGVPARKLFEALRFTFLVDVLLAPIGFLVALACPRQSEAIVFLVFPTALLALLQRDRKVQIDRAIALSQAVTETANEARLDVLTGLANRLAWEEALARAAHWPGAIGIVLADVDGLKRANDTFGHEMGDRLIAAVAALLRRHSPDGHDSVLARLGGDEFGLLLTGNLAPLAIPIADTLKAAVIAEAPIDGAVPVSASIGAAIAADAAHLGPAIAEADRGVYDDKTRRNAVRR